jgi:hypothetical protein
VGQIRRSEGIHDLTANQRRPCSNADNLQKITTIHKSFSLPYRSHPESLTRYVAKVLSECKFLSEIRRSDELTDDCGVCCAVLGIYVRFNVAIIFS